MAESNNTKSKRGTFVDNLNNFSFEYDMTRADRLPEKSRAVVPAGKNRKITKGRASGGRASGGRGIGEE